MAIGNEELMHEWFPKHLIMRKEESNKIKTQRKKVRRVIMEKSTAGPKNEDPTATTARDYRPLRAVTPRSSKLTNEPTPIIHVYTKCPERLALVEAGCKMYINNIRYNNTNSNLF